MTHLHITSWVIAIILFIVALTLLKNKNEKGARITSMILRLFYILVIVTGVVLFLQFNSGGTYHVKMLAGVLVIAMMEMILAFTKKGRSTALYWVLFIVILFATIYLGFKLPLGIQLF